MRALLSVADRAGIADLARELLDLGVEVYATDGRTIVFMDEAFDTGPVAARETYAEFLPVGPISNRLEYTGARVRCRGEAEFQLEPCT